MKYNPAIHHRRSIRLKGYDYSQSGMYFVTICCQDRICRFGKIGRDNLCGCPEMILNDLGKIACNEWEKLQERYPNVLLDVFQIMPNHIHGIIVLNNATVGATLAVAPNAMRGYKGRGQAPPLRWATSLGHINHWLQINVWKFLNQKMNTWGNYGNAIIGNILSVMMNPINALQIT